MQIEPDILELIHAYGNACYFDGVQNQTTGDAAKPRQALIDRIAALPARTDDSAVERVIAAVETTGLLAGDEARDVARAAIAALGGSGSL